MSTQARLTKPVSKATPIPLKPAQAPGLQSTSALSPGGLRLAGGFQEVLHSPGEPLDPSTQAAAGARFGHDFSQVRVHTDAQAARAAEAVQARAYTVGNHIVFNAGTFNPASQSGKSLLAHELTHTLQQRTGHPGRADAPAAEREAEQNARQILQPAAPLTAGYAAGAGIARQTKTDAPEMAEVVVPKDDPNSYLVFFDTAISKDRRLLLPAGTKIEVLSKTGEWRDVRVVAAPDPDRRGKLKEKFIQLAPAGEAKAPEAQDKKPEPQGKKADPQPAAEGGGTVDPLKKPAKEIMADDKYFDNNITKMEYYAAQEAHVFYKDGSKLELGLVPPYVKDPFEGVDYHTPKSTHISVVSDEPGTMKYIPRGSEVRPPAQTQTKYGDVLQKLTRTITFKVEPGSKRIIPTQVNTLTAPILCQMLNQSEEEYGKLMDATSKGGVKIFEAFKRVLEIYSFLPGGSLAKAAETKAATTVATTASESMVAALVKKLAEILAKGGVARELVVEGVALGEVVVGRKGTALAVEYTFIENVGRVAGQGRALQVALEQAAVQTAKAAGATEAQVIVHTVTNPKWLAYLESLGYTKTVIEKVGEFGAEGVFMKVIKVGG
jgi:hypothetical protein